MQLASQESFKQMKTLSMSPKESMGSGKPYFETQLYI
jgi:hypothetical protein